MKIILEEDMMPSRQAPFVSDPSRFLSEDAYRALLAKIAEIATWPAVTHPQLHSTWRGDVRWARNRTTLAGDWRDVTVGIQMDPAGSGPLAWTNQIDPASLRAVIGWVEQMIGTFAVTPDQAGELSQEISAHHLYPPTHIWSQQTYDQTPDERLQIANHLIAGADNAGMLSAGYLSVEAHGYVQPLPGGHRLLYAPLTEVQCSMTVRDPDGTGSGWAGVSSYDWGRIDANTLAAAALDKCLKSRNPIAIEPGRYTTILDPQATFALVDQLWQNIQNYGYWSLQFALSRPEHPFHASPGRNVHVSDFGNDVLLLRTKIGQRVFDPRINISFDPLDPDLGRVPFAGIYPIQPIQWVTNGVLTTLSYPPVLPLDWIEQIGHPMDPHGKPDLGSFRLDGGTTPTATLEEMIATTQRGLLVTRFWGVQLLDIPSALCTGTTRDGLWLIERGKISHAVRNLRFTESPLFVLNNLEQIGAAVPVFSPGRPAMAPRMKVRDFGFTALEDAI